MRGAAPNPTGAWRKELSRRGRVELVELRAEVEHLVALPAFASIRSLLVEAHDELVADMVNGPVRDASDYAKQTGTILGLKGVESLIAEIRSSAARAEKELADEAEASRPRMELA